ncbi:LamG-like jellyroll fold domain-containing protein [Dysgonomonas termitidis]|uniref:LamG-like jellyroll fold domain-containing protein n=1 Tax=Dysgonomonas termitidis TaxID=1516126 RepID=A0ABV9KS82_9BACT
MQKVKKWAPLIMAAFTILLCASCQDWGETDPPSGNQVYPKLEKIVTYSFEEEIDPAIIQLYAYSDGNTPALANDEERKSSVLHLNGGYAHINNPLNSVKVQNGVSLTFWMKQVVQTGENSGQDLEGALFSFQNENGTQKFFFTANGWLSYDGVDGKYEDNNPSGYKTGLLTAGEWHYVAMTIRDNGYVVYVDGQKKIDKEVTGFDFSKIVQFMASVPSLYLGYGSGAETQEWMLDDLTIYRNQITDSQIKVPGTGGEEEENNYIIVGNEDMSTPWWSAFSDLVTMQGDQTMHFGFYNYTNGVNNWHNWALVLTNGKNRDEAGYAEYFVLRADAWENISFSGTNITSDYNWDTFTTDMKGAYVDLTIKRTSNRIDVTAITTTTSGTVYTMNYFYEGTLASSIGSFLTCEGAYLAIDPETVYVGQQYAPDTYLVGPADLSAGWWSYFSNFSLIKTNPFVYTFINNTSGAANWNNWLLVVTNGKDRGEAGYAEYFVLRADAFGWGPEGSGYNAANISASYDWDSFTTQMKGAYCMIILRRSGNRLDMTAKVTTADGVKLGDYTFFYEGITTTDVGAFLTVEGASLNMRTVGYYPFLNAAE